MYFCRVRYARAQIGLLLAVLSLRATHSFSPAFRCEQSHVQRGFGHVSVRACTQVRVSQVHVRVHTCMQLHTHTHTHTHIHAAPTRSQQIPCTSAPINWASLQCLLASLRAGFSPLPPLSVS